MTETTLELRLIRHGKKLPNNQLSEEGRQEAYALGVSLAHEYDFLAVVTSAFDRAVMTGSEIQRGYTSTTPAQQDAGLEMYIPLHVRQDIQSGRLSVADAVKSCYRMVRPDVQSNPEESVQLRNAAGRYLSVAMQYLSGQKLPEDVQIALAQAKKPLIILVGHDPQIGGVEQTLKPTADLTEVHPLGGIIFVKTETGVQYRFTNNVLSYQGVLKQ